MRTTDTLRDTTKAEDAANLRSWSTNGPLGPISIDDGTVGGKESSEVKAHTKHLVGAGDELLDGAYTVVREVVARWKSEG